MRISIGQILILLIISFLLFGNFDNLKKNLTSFLAQINNLVKNRNKKKDQAAVFKTDEQRLYQLSYFPKLLPQFLKNKHLYSQ
jgi:Sec-independent protein translocase protein TatA